VKERTAVRPSGWSDRTRETVYSHDAFTRLDEEDDRTFYAADRLVSHLDNLALATVEKLAGALIVEREPVILDLMASWDSHLPAGLRPARLVGLGMNARELAANERLDQRLVHDLNRRPILPLPDAAFDAVLCTVSVDYLVRPFTVFAEVERVLRPGGMFLVVFSNRMFTRKAVKIWREASEAERILIVEDYFQATPGFGESRLWISQGKPRPRCDRYADSGLPSDPIYAVWAEKEGGAPGRPERVPPPAVARQPWDEERVAARKLAVGETLACPYCERPLSKWAVPENPFTEWDTPYFWICFNDRCPFLVHGWDAMNSQGNRGFSYRFRYDPERDACGAIPVPSLGALRASIVAE
jgi:SAM-dependent methyltransferase